jgi:hypothetical protein
VVTASAAFSVILPGFAARFVDPTSDNENHVGSNVGSAFYINQIKLIEYADPTIPQFF